MDNIHIASTRNLDLWDEELDDFLVYRGKISHDPKHHDCPLPSLPHSPNTSLQSEQCHFTDMYRMYAKLKPTAIPTARVSMNVLPTGGLNGTETIKSTFQAQP